MVLSSLTQELDFPSFQPATSSETPPEVGISGQKLKGTSTTTSLQLNMAVYMLFHMQTITQCAVLLVLANYANHDNGRVHLARTCNTVPIASEDTGAQLLHFTVLI